MKKRKQEITVQGIMLVKLFCIKQAAKASNSGDELVATAEYLFKWILPKGSL